MAERPPSRLEALQKRCERGWWHTIQEDVEHAIDVDLPDLAHAFFTVGEALRAAHQANEDPYDGWPGPVVAEALAIVDEWLGVPE